MKVDKIYSHLNGEEYLLVHKKSLYDEILEVIGSVDVSNFQTKISKEHGKTGAKLLNLGELNEEFERLFQLQGWGPVRRDFYVPDIYEIVQQIEQISFNIQKEYTEKNNHPLITSSTQADLIKENIAIEFQFGNLSAVTYDLFVKHLSFYNGGIINVGIEIIPSKEMQRLMSSGPPYFEKEVHNVLRHGRSSPAVPIVMIGISP